MKRENRLISLVAFMCLALLCNARTISTANELYVLFKSTTESVLNEDIDLADDLDFQGIDVNASLGRESSTMYTGRFNGNGHTINNLIIHSNNRTGLFFACGNTTITDLVIGKNCSFTGFSAAGLCVKVFGSATFRRVTNKANVTGNGVSAGGFIGEVCDLEPGRILFENCINEGTIRGQDYTGGFIGDVVSSDHKVIEFVDCTNHGTITELKANSMRHGGIIGALIGCSNVSLSITNTVNNGSIEHGTEMGGFLGRVDECDTTTILVKNSTNNGIVQVGDYLGGFIGSVLANDDTYIIFIDSTNNGPISGSWGVAGFIGQVSFEKEDQNTPETRFHITGCINNGRVDGSESVGGFFGEVSYSGLLYNITQSVNSGDVSGQKKNWWVLRFGGMPSWHDEPSG